VAFVMVDVMFVWFSLAEGLQPVRSVAEQGHRWIYHVVRGLLCRHVRSWHCW